MCRALGSIPRAKGRKEEREGGMEEEATVEIVENSKDFQRKILKHKRKKEKGELGPERKDFLGHSSPISNTKAENKISQSLLLPQCDGSWLPSASVSCCCYNRLLNG
jgi:hypothetical protein